MARPLDTDDLIPRIEWLSKNIMRPRGDYEYLPKVHYEFYDTCYKIENALRTFVYAILKSRHQDQWTNCGMRTDDGKPWTIRETAKQRAARGGVHGYLGADDSFPLAHLTLGELMRLMTDDRNWPLFRVHFPMGKKVLEAKLSEVTHLRNAFAHFRRVTKSDLACLQQVAAQCFIGVEACLQKLFGYEVDTTPEMPGVPWYRDLACVGDSEHKLRICADSERTWIKCAYDFPARPLTPDGRADGPYANLITPNIPEQVPDLGRNLVCVFEDVPAPLYDPEDRALTKPVWFIFAVSCLERHREEVARGFGTLFAAVAKETTLLEQNPAAEGRLVRPCTFYLNKQGLPDSWKRMFFGRSSGDTIEYWNPVYLECNIMASLVEYPWMCMP